MSKYSFALFCIMSHQCKMQNEDIRRIISTNVKKYNSTKIQRNTKNEIQHIVQNTRVQRANSKMWRKYWNFEILKLHKDLNSKNQPNHISNFNYWKIQIVNDQYEI